MVEQSSSMDSLYIALTNDLNIDVDRSLNLKDHRKINVQKTV